jgi:hypothetical protein
MKTFTSAALAAAILSLGSIASARAAENGVSWYLLGFKGPGAALTPPEGVFIQNDLYTFSGSAKAARDLPLNGYVGAGIKGTAIADMMSILWVTPAEIFGGKLGVSLTQPVGGPTITASAAAVPPFGIRGPLAVGAHDSASFFGDPIATAFLGWNAGQWHIQAGTSTNVPIGYYDTTGFANLSFHRWATDLFASATWLDPTAGIDISSTVGYTINGTNNFTNYKTGNEVHLEGSISKALTKEFSVGLLGYYYQQVTADSGAGATLGSFEGRVAAIGATAAYNFQVGIIPISARVKVFKEFDAKNRLNDGTVGFLTLAMPIWVPNPPHPVTAKY